MRGYSSGSWKPWSGTLPELPRPLPALGASEAFIGLAKALGLAIGADTLQERLEAGASTDVMAGLLEEQGLHPRWAETDLRDLAHLDLPSMLLLKDGRWLLATGREGRKLLLSGPEGERAATLKELKPDYAGTALDLLPGLPEGNLWMRVLKMVLLHRKALGGILFIAILTQLLNLALPEFTRVLVDQAFPQGAISLFYVLVIGNLAVGLFQAWISWLEQHFFLYFQIRLDALLERGVLIHLLRLPFPFLQSKTVGELMQGFSGFSAAKDLITGDVLGSLLSGATSIMYVVFMARLMPAGTVLVVAGSLVMALAAAFIGRQQVRLQRAQVAVQAKQRSYLVEMMTGTPTIKAAGAEEMALSRWTALLRRDRYLGLHGQRVNLGIGGVLGGLSQLQTQVLLIWGGQLAINGQLQLGELLAFNLYAGAFTSAVMGFASSLVKVWMAKPFLEIAEELLDQVPEPPRPSLRAAELPGPILVEDLWFRYSPEHPWIFQGLNLHVEPGGKHQIEGPSGFGKSTLLRILAGFYTPERGSVRIGSHSPAQAKGLSIYLPQFVKLFDGSLLENLRLLSGGASRDRLMEAAALTGLDAYVETLPMGYETVLAQSGANLSGGQRQLVALTAVLASDKPLLLLDEAMANLDPLRKARLSQSALFKNKTVVFASHDGDLSLGALS